MLLSQLLKLILKVPYHSNPQKTPYHELALRKIFIDNGFKEFPSSSKTFNQKEFWKNHRDPKWDKHNNIPNNVFISQPFGSQATPDFIFKYKNILIPLEAKSSKDTKPAYNGTLPHPYCIYAFTSQKYDKHTIFLGKDVVGQKERQFLENLSYKIELIIKEAEAEYYKENNDETQRGFHLYHRAKYQQKCEHISCSNDYFKHPDKDKCEKNVIAWIESLENLN
jgi:hypothetical protein